MIVIGSGVLAAFRADTSEGISAELKLYLKLFHRYSDSLCLMKSVSRAGLMTGRAFQSRGSRLKLKLLIMLVDDLLHCSLWLADA